jgi:tRNA modification GTPase
LINLLARREVAIVSPHAGTTRDIIEVQLDLDGYPVTVIDTAGIRETEDPVEQEGVRRARMRAAEADLVLWMTDVEHPHNGINGNRSTTGTPDWLVRNKIDLGGVGGVTPGRCTVSGLVFAISASRGDGVPDLIAALVDFARQYFGSGEGGLIGRERQRRLLQQTADSLQRSAVVMEQGEELAAEELRAASHSLGRLLGRVDVEDILNSIFRDFCIGK